MKWAQFHLNGGVVDGEPLISREQSRKAKMIYHTGTNSIKAEPRFAIMYRLVDLFLGLEDYDYNSALSIDFMRNEHLDPWIRK